MLAATAIARAHVSAGWGGAPSFRGVYTAALGLLALSVSLATWAIVRRWASSAGAHLGALVVWSIITLLVTWKLPGVSFLFVWPLLAGTVAAEVRSRVGPGLASRPTTSRAEDIRLWSGTLVAVAIVVPVVYAVSAVMLGAVGPGGIAAAALVSLLAWLLAPQMNVVAAGKPWRAAAVATAFTGAVIAAGMLTVRSAPRHPVPSVIVYALSADSTNAWLVARGSTATLVASPSQPAAQAPTWMQRAYGTGPTVTYHAAPRIAIDPPSVAVVADSSVNGERRLLLHVRAARGTENITMRATDGRVMRAAVDGRPIDTTRYRRRTTVWTLSYAAPSDSGLTLALALPARSGVVLELVARSALPRALPGVELPARPAHVVTAQTGDITVVHRAVRID
jgi:hypothetical protein